MVWVRVSVRVIQGLMTEKSLHLQGRTPMKLYYPVHGVCPCRRSDFSVIKSWIILTHMFIKLYTGSK